MSKGFCFYKPTVQDGIEYMTPQWSWDKNNGNQRWVNGEMMGFCFIMFIVSLVSIVVMLGQSCAIMRKSMMCFKFFGCFGGLGGCLGFVMFILVSIARWSEGGRACSGEYFAEQGPGVTLDGIDYAALEETCQNSETG